MTLFDRIVFKLKRCFVSEVLVLGDSHAKVFQETRLQRGWRHLYFDVVAVDGATVSGLANPNSETQALPIFMARSRTSKARVAVVLLGEVDTGFVIWFRAEKYRAPIESMLAQAVKNYQDLLRTLGGRFRLVCISAPLPTIADGQAIGIVANARRGINASQRQRTELTLEFNRQMRSWCSANGIDYVDLDPFSLGPDGLVAPRLLNSDAADHHYERHAYAELLASQLGTILRAANMRAS
jgi:hypothetical protein